MLNNASYNIVKARRNSNFLPWLDFKRIIIKDYKKYVVAVLVMIFLSCLVVFVILPLYIDVSNNATAQFAGKSFSALILALIFSFIKTGLAEEIFLGDF